MDKIEKIRQWIERRKNYISVTHFTEELLSFLDTLSEESETKEKKQPDNSMEEAAEEYEKEHTYQRYDGGGLTPEYNATLAEAFNAGAEWQKGQFEKNRLAACDAQTREEYERETDFVDKFITKNQRTPTFSDAINYGIAWQKEKMLKNAVEGYVNYYEGSGILMAEAPVGCPYHNGDKVKIVIVKED